MTRNEAKKFTSELKTTFTKVSCPNCQIESEYLVLFEQGPLLYYCPTCNHELRISSRIEAKRILEVQ